MAAGLRCLRGVGVKDDAGVGGRGGGGEMIDKH